jgi:hypothetical protein
MRLSYKLLRNLHLATTPVLGAFVYASPLRENPTFVAIVQWGIRATTRALARDKRQAHNARSGSCAHIQTPNTIIACPACSTNAVP